MHLEGPFGGLNVTKHVGALGTLQASLSKLLVAAVKQRGADRPRGQGEVHTRRHSAFSKDIAPRFSDLNNHLQ